MDENSELTNVPDYQKIMQTNQSAGGQGSSAGHNTVDWNESIETITPSPVVRHPLPAVAGTSEQQHFTYRKYGQEIWDNKQALSGPAKLLDTNRASWESQSQYDASKYGLVSHSTGRSPYKDEPTYIPQGYIRPVTKYIDANGVEHRVIKRTVSPNRRSFTEGLVLKDNSELNTGGSLKTASSQKNLHYNYSSPSLGFKRNISSYSDGLSDSTLRPGFIKRSPMTQSMEYLVNSKSPMPGNGLWKNIGEGHTMKSSPENLRHWQQQHQEELLHQHLETQALYESPNSQSAHTSLDHALGRVSLQDEPQAVRRAADNIIREKNMIIDKLKNRILELEEDFKISEDKLRQAIVSKGDDVDIVKQKLQEVQHKNAVLKEQLNEERAKKNSEIDDLEMKLGSAEYQISQLEEVLRNKDVAVSNIQSQLTEKMQEAEAWKIKFTESGSSHQEMKKRLDGLQRYLDDLPTVEESRLQVQQVLSLREENVGLKAKSESQEKKLTQMRKTITARDFRIRELEEREKDLEKKVQEVTQELSHLRENEGSELYNTQKDLEGAKADTERLAVDLEKAKKLLETTHVKLRQVEMKYQAELRAAKERLTLEEQTVESLRAEVGSKEEQIVKMAKSVKELGVQNQELLQQYLVVKEQMRHLEGKSMDANGILHHRLMLQMKICFSELQALVQVCSQCARGETPDISTLLGVKSLESEDGQEGAAAAASGGQSEPANSTKVVTQWLGQLGQLRKDIERLRAYVCNKYAEDMGDNIICATQ